jgi:tetratricopeptide (TPR) repeat protein
LIRNTLFIPLALLTLSAPPARADHPPEPDSATSLKQSVAAALQSGDATEALRLIQSRPTGLDPFDRAYLTGCACLALGRADEAIAALTAATQRRPESAESHYHLGQAFRAAGRRANAVAAFERADLRGMRTAALDRAWAATLLELDRPLGTPRTVTRDAPAEPGDVLDDVIVVVRRAAEANHYVAAERGSALFHACRAARRDPFDGRTWLLVADAWRAAGLPDEAAPAYGRAVTRLRGEARRDGLKRWAECRFEYADYAGFLDRYDDLFAQQLIVKDDYAEALLRAARAYASVGDAERQLAVLHRGVEQLPDDRTIRGELSRVTPSTSATQPATAPALSEP